MDLYKHAFRLTPMVPSDLVADCFDLADIRVSTCARRRTTSRTSASSQWGSRRRRAKAAYVEAQRAFASAERPLRARLIAECERLLGEA